MSENAYQDPLLLKRPPVADAVLPPFVLEDPKYNPGMKFTLHLRRLNSLDLNHAENKKIEYWHKHFVHTPSKPMVPLPAVDGQAVLMTETTCRILATIEMAQIADEEEGQYRYSFERLAAMATVPALADQLLEAYVQITLDEPIPDKDVNDPNSLGSADTTPSSAGPLQG